MLFRKSLLLILAVSVITFQSCDNDSNEITINILEPAAGEVFTDAADVHVHIEVSAEEEVDAVMIKLHPVGQSDSLILNYDEHVHEQSFEFEQDFDLSSYPSGTSFEVDIIACKDHDCEETVTANVDFSIE